MMFKMLFLLFSFKIKYLKTEEPFVFLPYKHLKKDWKNTLVSKTSSCSGTYTSIEVKWVISTLLSILNSTGHDRSCRVGSLKQIDHCFESITGFHSSASQTTNVTLNVKPAGKYLSDRQMTHFTSEEWKTQKTQALVERTDVLSIVVGEVVSAGLFGHRGRSLRDGDILQIEEAELHFHAH